MKLQVRSATKNDLIRIHEMDIESYGPQTAPITSLIWLVERQGDQPVLFLSVGEEVADDGKKSLVGFIAWKEFESEPGIKAVEVLHLVIAKNYRNEGMGEGLLNEVLENARARGFRGASMNVPLSHEGAVRLLTKLGFQEYQRVPGYFQQQGDGMVFVKVLNFPQGM